MVVIESFPVSYAGTKTPPEKLIIRKFNGYTIFQVDRIPTSCKNGNVSNRFGSKNSDMFLFSGVIQSF